MTVFDRAWDVVKMPLVPGSIRYDGPHVVNDEEPVHAYSAEFHDPVDDRKYPMFARYYPSDDEDDEFIRIGMSEDHRLDRDKVKLFSLWPNYTDPEVDFTKPLATSAIVSPTKYAENLYDTSWSGHISAYPQRRGKGTALYDMVAAILDHRAEELSREYGLPKERIKLVPHASISDDAKALWRGKEEGWPVPDEPIR